MPDTTSESERFILPDRIRLRGARGNDLAARMKLIDRIADLPGIESVERNDEGESRRIEILLRAGLAEKVLNRTPGTLFLGVDAISINLHGLNRWERHQILAHGWGRLVSDHVSVHLPRDEDEVEVIWKIVRRAYERLYEPATAETQSPAISTWDLPQFVRTSLQ